MSCASLWGVEILPNRVHPPIVVTHQTTPRPHRHAHVKTRDVFDRPESIVMMTTHLQFIATPERAASASGLGLCERPRTCKHPIRASVPRHLNRVPDIDATTWG